jgi:hypothetical protein
MPPEHILIIDGHITSSISNTTRQRIDRHLRHRIITTCGDANVMMGSKHIDPALCIYIGAYLICIDNTRNCDKLPKSSQRAPRELPESSQRAPRELPSPSLSEICVLISLSKTADKLSFLETT